MQQELVFSEPWKEVFTKNKLLAFDPVWDLSPTLDEVCEDGSSDISSVCRVRLNDLSGLPHTVILKRQSLTIDKKTKKTPLPIEREFNSIKQINDRGLTTAAPLIGFGTRINGDQRQAFMLTEDLEGYISLYHLLTAWQTPGLLNRQRKQLIMDAFSQELKRLHDSGFSHNALYPEHIFVRFHDDCEQSPAPEVEFKLIDFKFAKKSISRSKLAYRDLTSFYRHAFGISRSERLRFLMKYHNVDKAKRVPRRNLKKILNAAIAVSP